MGPIMLFIMNFSQSVVCMFRLKKIYKVINLKVDAKWRYLIKNPFSRTTKKKKSLV